MFPFLVRDRKVDEVIVVVRRGPADVKFNRKEMENVARNLDMAAFEAEFAGDPDYAGCRSGSGGIQNRFPGCLAPGPRTGLTDTFPFRVPGLARACAG